MTHLPQIDAHHLYELLGTLEALSIRRDLRPGHMSLNVLFQDLQHQTLDGPAHGGDLLQNFSAAPFVLQRSFQRLDLAANAANPGQQLLLFPPGVTHRFPLYTPGGYCI